MRAGWVFHLTLGESITGAQFAQLKRRFFNRLSRVPHRGWHWVAEFQSRGAVHLHLFWLGLRPWAVERAWLCLAARYGAAWAGQRIGYVAAGAMGWRKYQAKHGARGVHNYQRRLPEALDWRGAGRMWGVRGDFPLCPVRVLRLTRKSFFAFRRRWRKLLAAQGYGIHSCLWQMGGWGEVLPLLRGLEYVQLE